MADDRMANLAHSEAHYFNRYARMLKPKAFVGAHR